MIYRVTIEPLGETIEVEEGQTLLDAALRAGLWLPYACNHGLCGTCKIQVLEGLVSHNDSSPFALMDVERDEGKCLACSATPESDLVVEAELEEEPDARHLPIENWEATVVELRDLTPTIKGVFLQIEGGEFDFQAGQYINLRVPGEATPRAFSLANAPQEPVLELNVRRVAGGQATAYIHEHLAVGDRVAFEGPLGRFFVRRAASEPVLFLAGGSGLSSPKAMVLDLLLAGDARPITLIHGARNRAELYYRDHFAALAVQHDNFRYVPALSEPRPEEAWEGEVGLVHEVAGKLFEGRFAGYKAYLCGPPPMIDACLTELMRGRLFEDHIFTEVFLTAADAEGAPRRSAFFKKF